MKKILFTDLDGTLLNNEKMISEGNRRAIQRLLDEGHFLVIATGRPIRSGMQVVKQLGFTSSGCYMIAYNGGVIYDCAQEEICMERTFPLEHVSYLFEEAKKYGIHIQTYGENDEILTESDGPELEYYMEINRRTIDCEIRENVCANLSKEPKKVLLIDFCQEILMKFQDDHKEWENGKCNSFFSCREYLEYLPFDVNKGAGVKLMCEMLNVDLKDAYAAGDEQNDISMIQAAGVGVAMKNATPEVKAVADYVTENDNEHDGIAEVIDRLILQRR